VPEVELDLLEGALDEEAGEGVHDGPQSGQRQSGGRPDQELFADPDVDHPVRVSALCLHEAVSADLGQDDRDPGILVEQP
jgi:hypothetical protein